MESTLPPDPYEALGIPPDATAATIKSTYRKLVLKCHPDKVADEALKKQKQEEFHKIQQAYELLSDEDKRDKYDRQVKLERDRKERLARGGTHTDAKASSYGVRTQAPAGATVPTPRYEEHKPASRSYEDDRHYDERASRKYETYDSYPRHSSSRSSRPEKEPARASKPSSDRTRSERTKTRDREERRDRATKFATVRDDTSSSDEKSKYESSYRRRSDEEYRRREEEDIRKKAAEARRKAEEHRSYEEEEYRRRRSEEAEYDRQRKLKEQADEAARYIQRSRVEGDRPSASRTTSSRDARPEVVYERSSGRRPETVRRSSARPKERSSGRESVRDRKGMPEIVDWERENDRRASPTDGYVPHLPRAETFQESRRVDRSPPAFRRSETMPVSSSSSRRKDATAPRPSTMRTSETAAPPESVYPTVPPPQTTTSTIYHYPTPGGGVRLAAEDVVGVGNGHKTVYHAPARSHTTSQAPPPLSRPPIGPNRPLEPTSSRMPSSHAPPPLGRTATMHTSPTRIEERGRSRPLYGEIPSDTTRREPARRQFPPDSVQYAQYSRVGPEDPSWSSPTRGRTEDREYSKPPLGRHATFVY